MKITPLGKGILVSAIKEAQKQNGLFIVSREKQKVGTVMSVGAQSSGMVKRGDKVLLPMFDGPKVVVGKKVYHIVSEDEILAVFL